MICILYTCIYYIGSYNSLTYPDGTVNYIILIHHSSYNITTKQCTKYR